MIFIRADEQWFIPPVNVNQAENYTQDLQWNLSSDWLVHNMFSGYMDKDGWIKAMNLFSMIYVAIKINLHALLFDGNDSHFDDRATHILQSHQIS